MKMEAKQQKKAAKQERKTEIGGGGKKSGAREIVPHLSLYLDG